MMSDKTSQESPIEIAIEDLSPEALYGVIESFVLREGTDYGAQEVSLEKKIEQISKQLKSKRARIFFDQTSETISLVPTNAPR
jgi:uncharacterized protein